MEAQDMRLSRLMLRNFRCYKEAISIDFDDLTTIIGKNDAGKSTIMEALSIFFEESKLDKDDITVSCDENCVEIACEFDDLPGKIIIDQDFATSLENEYLLTDIGTLEIIKQYNGATAAPKLTGTFARANHPSKDKYNDLLQLKNKELQARAKELDIDISNVNKKANAPIREAIWKNESNLEVKMMAIPLDSGDGKQIWAQLSAYIPSFALFKSDRASTDQDPEAQDPLKAAIRDAIKEKELELLEIQKHVENEVNKIAMATVEKIREMDPSLASTLSPIVTTKKWDSLFQTSITGDYGIPLNKRGSGVKRLVLLNFFRAKAERAAFEKNAGSVIYAIEEPETSQHPRNQRMLMAALTEIAAAPGRQVILTTHTPMLARSVPNKTLRFIQTKVDGSREILKGSSETNELISKSLGILPDNNVKIFIGVEGKHDISFLKNICKIIRQNGTDIPDLEALELDGQLIFFPFGGENLVLWASRLRHLNRPELHLCDRDNEPPLDPKYKSHIDQVNAREGCLAICTTKREMENYVHYEAVVEAYNANGCTPNITSQFADFDDVPALVAKSLHEASTTETSWEDLDERTQKKKVSSAKVMLNGQAITCMTVERLKETDPADEVLKWFNTIKKIMESAA